MSSRTTRSVFAGLAVIFFIAAPMFLAMWSLATIEGRTASERLGYRLSDVRTAHAPVPRVFLKRLPRELPTISSVKERKSLFIRILLPLILQVNEDILEDRKRLIALQRQLATGAGLADRDRKWLSGLAAAYRVKDGDLDELVLRVDVIPPSLALAQAAIESGWGTSRFAQQANALYGQWTFDGSGIVPGRRDDGRKHRIKAFPRLLQSVSEYARNLNRHAAYARLRAVRAQLRASGTARGVKLAETLLSYSERGALYVSDLRTIILSNHFLDFDRSGLEKPA
ncbi:MAG: glucosaminidase domain-containing protein [Sphingomonadales bacterium]